MMRLQCVLILLVSLCWGCGPKEYPALTSDSAKQFASGTPLAQIEESLGDPHPPTIEQAKHLGNMIANMPETIRSNASKDQSLAWGNDAKFLVVKVNDKGIAWVTSWREGSPKP